MPLFGGLGSSSAPFLDGIDGVTFQGLAGQPTSGDNAIPFVLDGESTWMSVPTGNGQFTVDLGAGNASTSTLYTSAGRVDNTTDYAAVQYNALSITFSVTGTPPVTTYDVMDTTSGASVVTAQPYKAGQAISIPGYGMSIIANGVPADADVINITPSPRGAQTSPTPDGTVFGIVDRLISELSSTQAKNQVTQSVTRGLAEIDTAMDRLQRSRGFAGTLLNKADSISDLQGAREVQLEADRSRAEDLDMIQAIADFQNQQTGYDAALKSYAQIQKLSLFNYLG
jgi:flagellar hook-associated protein 3 FlgL